MTFYYAAFRANMFFFPDRLASSGKKYAVSKSGVKVLHAEGRADYKVDYSLCLPAIIAVRLGLSP